MNLMNFMNQYFNQIILTLILALAAFLGAQLKNLYKKFVNTEIKQAVCRDTVRYIEQIYKDIHGPEKLAQAMAKASELLQSYGITISESELVTMLEAAVNEFNNAFAKDYAQGQHLPGAPAFGPAVEDPAPVPAPSVSEIIADMKDID